MFYLFRIIFIIILVLSAWFLTRWYIKKKIAKGKTFTRRKINIILLCLFSSVVLLSALSFIPFEGAFLRFDSVEDSLKYKMMDSKNLTIHYEDDFAIAVKGCDEFYAFDKNDEGFGLVNYHSATHKYNEHVETTVNHYMFRLHAVYLKTTDKTFYLLSNGMNGPSKEIADNDNLGFTYFAQPLFTKFGFGYTSVIGTVYQYYAVTDGQPLDKVSFIINDQLKTFTY